MTLEEALAENTGLKAQVTTLESAQERTNRESKTHRLNAEAFQRQADEFRTKAESAQQALAEAEARHASDVDKVKLDLTARAAAAETKATQATEAAQGRVLMAKLESAAEKAGIGNLAYLKLFDDRADFTANDDGHLVASDGKPVDTVAWFAAKKEAFPHLFGQPAATGATTGTTTSTTQPPKPATPSGFDARKVPTADYAAAKREMLAQSGTR